MIEPHSPVVCVAKSGNRRTLLGAVSSLPAIVCTYTGQPSHTAPCLAGTQTSLHSSDTPSSLSGFSGLCLASSPPSSE